MQYMSIMKLFPELDIVSFLCIYKYEYKYKNIACIFLF